MTRRARSLDDVPGLRDLAVAQQHVVRREQLRTLGITHDHVRRQVEAERWRVIGPRVVVLSTGVLTRRQQFAVAVAHAGPQARLAARTALESLGLTGWERPEIRVLVPHGRLPPPLRGVVVQQSRNLREDDVRRPAWPACSSPARAAVDAATLERNERTACGLVLAVVQRGLATGSDLLSTLDRFPSARHAVALREVLGERGADSLSEIDVADLVRRAGLGEPVRQFLVETPEGARRLDLAVTLPDGRTLLVQVDGPQHLDPRARRADAELDAWLVAAGYVVLRIPAGLSAYDRARLLDRLRAIARPPR